jgi:SAM-dependent methyltransferase
VSTDWSGFLAEYHGRHPGITEALLGRSFDRDHTPYDWLVEALPPGRVLDLACGSAPWWSARADRTYVGIEVSGAELAAARGRGAHPLVRGRADVLALAPASVDAVAISMALQLTEPLHKVLEEVARVLRPGGVLVATVPVNGPLRPSEWWRICRLCVAVGHLRLRYPNDRALRRPRRHLASARLRLHADERRRFTFTPTTADDDALVVDSLYLAGLSERRRATGIRIVAGWRARGLGVPIPVRRLVAVRDSG